MADAAHGERPFATVATVAILTGPTGSGKSEWAIRAARELPIDIVSVDSAMVYRGLDIGTAKPAPAVRADIPHHLIDIREPSEAYSAGEFVADATRLIGQIQQRGRLPLLVGGTMLYLRALRRGLAVLPLASPAVRRDLAARAASAGWPALHAELARVDRVAAARIHPNDAQRLQRALEVYLTTGRPISAWHRETPTPPEWSYLHWALLPAREVLHERIERRFTDMMSRGFLKEVERLRERGDLHLDHPSMRAVGYRQLWAHLDGAYGLAEAISRGIAATRQLSKRQTTWLRAETSAVCLDPDGADAYARWRDALIEAVFPRGRGASARGTI
jgi:tRNA dimethylallyltransferase